MKTLFELPVYVSGREEYDRKYDTKIRKELDAYSRKLEEEEEPHAGECMKRHENRCSGRKMEWKFNRIIGYLSVKFDEEKKKVKFDICIEDEPVRFDSMRKREMLPWTMLGESFKVDSTMTNEEIAGKMTSIINGFKVNDLPRRYIDDGCYLNLIDHLDLRGIMGL